MAAGDSPSLFRGAHAPPRVTIGAPPIARRERRPEGISRLQGHKARKMFGAVSLWRKPQTAGPAANGRALTCCPAVALFSFQPRRPALSSPDKFEPPWQIILSEDHEN